METANKDGDAKSLFNLFASWKSRNSSTRRGQHYENLMNIFTEETFSGTEEHSRVPGTVTIRKIPDSDPGLPIRYSE